MNEPRIIIRTNHSLCKNPLDNDDTVININNIDKYPEIYYVMYPSIHRGIYENNSWNTPEEYFELLHDDRNPYTLEMMLKIYKKFPSIAFIKYDYFIDYYYKKFYNKIIKFFDKYYCTEYDLCKNIFINNIDLLIKIIDPNIIKLYCIDDDLKDLIKSKCELFVNINNLMKITSIKRDIFEYKIKNGDDDLDIYYGYSDLTIEGDDKPLHQNILVLDDSKYMPYIELINERIDGDIGFIKILEINNEKYMLYSYCLPEIDMYIDIKKKYYYHIHVENDLLDITDKDMRINCLGGWYSDDYEHELVYINPLTLYNGLIE